MRLYEGFTRCECGNATLVREVKTLAKYVRNEQGRVISFQELPEKRVIHYTCEKCKTLIHTERE